MANGKGREFGQYRRDAPGTPRGQIQSGNPGGFLEAGRWTGRVKIGKSIRNKRNSMKKSTGLCSELHRG